MTKATNYIVTATEVKTMVVAKQPVADSQQSVIKTGNIGVTNNFYVRELGNDLATYTANRLPRYQDIECPNTGLSMNVSTMGVDEDLIYGVAVDPIYNTPFTYRYLVYSPSPSAQTGDLIFTCTMPANVTLLAFRAVWYQGGPVPLPTSDYYVVTDFNTTTGYVRIVLKKPVDQYNGYIVAFNAKANQQFGVFSTTGYVDGNFYYCPQAYTIQAPISFTLAVPNMYVQKQVTNSAQSGCVTSKRYQIDVQSTGGSVIGGVLTDTLPSGLALDAFEAIFYDGVICPNPTSDYYEITQYQQGVNAGSFSVTLKKEIGNQHYYTMWFYVVNNSTSATYTNTATYTLPNSSPLITASGSVAASYTTLPSITYYELSGCDGIAYAFTTIVPLGLNNRYVLPGSSNVYIYTGNQVVQCTVPPAYNGSIQRTTSYDCADVPCDPTPDWVNTGTSCYGGCDLYYVQTDQNTCAGDPTSGQTRQGALIESNSTSCGGCCGQPTTPDWISNGAAYCDSCVSKQPQIDNNPCSPTSGQTRVINAGSACNTTQNWVNTGNYNCYGTCNKYNVEIQNNPCASGYNTTRQGSLVESNSTFCGGCCGQSTAATWVNTGSYSCYGTCNKYNIEVDNNSCSPTYNQTQQGTLVESNSTFCGGCCAVSPTANWVNNGATFCTGCTLYQPQIDNNVCSSTYGNTRNVNLGTNDSCGSWPTAYYCVGCAYYSHEVNSCTGNVRNTILISSDSTSCGGCCGQSTAATWTNEGSAYCESCVSKQLQRDTNPCSATYNQTRVINSGSACNTSANWVNSGNYNCYSTCNKYNVEVDNNPCSSTYNQTRQGSLVESNSTFCGGCCGQSTSPSWTNEGSAYCDNCVSKQLQRDTNPCSATYNQTRVIDSGTACNYTANWVNSGSYDCYGSCTKYNVEVDNNPCSSTYNQTRQGSVVEYNSTFCGGCCGQSTSPNWVDNGSTFCTDCNLYQPQIDSNPCSATYGDTRNVDLGVSTACGTWVQSFYCIGYDKWSKETNSCTGNIRNETLVEVNSPYCGYVPPPTCRTYQIVGDNADESVNGVYTNCAGGSDSFSFFGGPGTVGTVCAQTSTVYITSGNGYATDIGSCS